MRDGPHEQEPEAPPLEPELRIDIPRSSLRYFLIHRLKFHFGYSKKKPVFSDAVKRHSRIRKFMIEMDRALQLQDAVWEDDGTFVVRGEYTDETYIHQTHTSMRPSREMAIKWANNFDNLRKIERTNGLFAINHHPVSPNPNPDQTRYLYVAQSIAIAAPSQKSGLSMIPGVVRWLNFDTLEYALPGIGFEKKLHRRVQRVPNAPESIN